ncbi:Uncharacterised protein [Yersinia enterocolitica]|uniref:Uncharacterized protein n=1 Tax=Yersinia enterocolitica TaxID=630 RepID=A0A0H5HT99_YEREN|nr:Uncharacterised protein [Yersinia enterocolitica]CNC78398.1 Uncharacterised protein [Yersinia enterocolitica]CNE34513.1 Uncharacterised protein [Yersinia enterocolitica]CNI27117.1 Uncharacterised protein [Yersinia enterocolitica]CNI65946.1 Uncharacterised protein [Yersinia enterocolitica]
MCHSFLIISYWNDTEFLTLPYEIQRDTIYIVDLWHTREDR